jgi:hypothetical protein
MATRAHVRLQGEGFTVDFGSEIAMRPGVEAGLRRSRGFGREGGKLVVSTGAALNGAKGALLGIALEATCVAGLYCLWQIWRLAH